MRAVVSIDAGTTGVRAFAVADHGRPLGWSYREFPQHFPQPGWVEHDPLEIWSSQSAVIAEVLAMAKVSARDLAAVGIANQRETTLLWDRRTGVPVARAIVWQDRRTADLCAQLKAQGHGPDISQRTGLLLDPYFSGTKLAWLLEHVAGARERAIRGELAFGTVDSWLAWKLSNGRLHVTDATNASRTLLFNLHTGAWDDDLLALLGVPRACLPEVIPSSIADARERMAVEIAGHQVPLAGIAGDQQAALFGQTCFSPGMAKNTYGTGCFLLMNTGTQPLMSNNRLLSTVAWRGQDR